MRKSFWTLPDDMKELNESNYLVENNKTIEELNILWNVDMKFERKYAEDLYELGTNAKSNKYTFRVCENESHEKCSSAAYSRLCKFQKNRRVPLM